MTKTEQRLIDTARNSPRQSAHFHGIRERNAAYKLQRAGLVTVRDMSARVPSQNRNGHWVQGSYCWEGTIHMVGAVAKLP